MEVPLICLTAIKDKGSNSSRGFTEGHMRDLHFIKLGAIVPTKCHPVDQVFATLLLPIPTLYFLGKYYEGILDRTELGKQKPLWV